MTPIPKILFPVDFSPSCVAMAPFVQRAAAMLAANVTLLYVLEPSKSGFELLARPAPDMARIAKRPPARCSTITSPRRFPRQLYRSQFLSDGKRNADITFRHSRRTAVERHRGGRANALGTLGLGRRSGCLGDWNTRCSNRSCESIWLGLGLWLRGILDEKVAAPPARLSIPRKAFTRCWRNGQSGPQRFFSEQRKPQRDACRFRSCQSASPIPPLLLRRERARPTS